jgi:hypothetical protein
LATLSEDYDLEKTAVKITRRGTGTDTVYIILPAKDQPTPVQLKNIEAMDLNALEFKPVASHKELKNYAPGSDDDGGDLPF